MASAVLHNFLELVFQSKFYHLDLRKKHYVISRTNLLKKILLHVHTYKYLSESIFCSVQHF